MSTNGICLLRVSREKSTSRLSWEVINQHFLQFCGSQVWSYQAPSVHLFSEAKNPSQFPSCKIFLWSSVSLFSVLLLFLPKCVVIVWLVQVPLKNEPSKEIQLFFLFSTLFLIIAFILYYIYIILKVYI